MTAMWFGLAAALIRRERPWPALVPIAIVAVLLMNWILRWPR
jgi:hypothetical protein